jgi:hypothetical protein
MFLGSRERPVRKADNLTTICEPIVYATRDPQYLTALQTASVVYWSEFLTTDAAVPGSISGGTTFFYK